MPVWEADKVAPKNSSLPLCATCNQPLSPMRKTRLCFQCLCSRVEREGGAYFGSLSFFVAVKLGGATLSTIVQHWINWRVQMEVSRFHDTVRGSLNQQTKIPEISLRDYMLERVSTIHKHKEETQKQVASIAQNDLPLQGIMGVLLISEAIHCRRLWRRYFISRLRSRRGVKSATFPDRDLLLEAIFKYHLYSTCLIAGFAVLRRARRKIGKMGKLEEIYKAFGEAAKAILECRDSFTIEYPKHEVKLLRGERREQSLYELSALILAYAPLRRNRRLFAGLQELVASSNMTPKDVLIDLLPSQVEHAIRQNEPTDRLIKGRNSFRNRVLSQFEVKPVRKQELVCSPDEVERYREKVARRQKRASETEEFLMQEGIRRQIRRLFDEAKLSLRQRQVLERIYFEGLHQQEIADELGLNVNCVKTHRLRGIRKLKQASEKLRISHTTSFL